MKIRGSRMLRSRKLMLGVAACSLAAVAAIAAADTARAGTYTVAQCHELNRAFADATILHGNRYGVETRCQNTVDQNSLQLKNTDGASANQSATVSWTAPEGTVITEVEVEARLRRADGHKARLRMANAAGLSSGWFANGGTEAPQWETHRWTGNGRASFVAELICDRVDGCPQSDAPKVWIRNVEITLLDEVAPTVSLSGSITTPGWKRGEQTLRTEANDVGAGVRATSVTINDSGQGNQAGQCELITGSQWFQRLRPCANPIFFNPALNTAKEPFVDGDNVLRACGADASGALSCVDHSVQVDNTPPSLAFANSQDPDDPELIRAPVADATSGVAGGKILFRPVGGPTWTELETTLASGELRARVDSAAERPGNYEFLATASDVAGNPTAATKRSDGSEMVLEFPLRAPTSLKAQLPGGQGRQLARYRQASKVSGQLVDDHGRPLAGAPVTVVEHFDRGSLIDERVRQVVTNRHGRWRSRIPGGPSRRITAAYEGSRRYTGSAASGLDFNVRSQAVLRPSKRRVRAGQAVVFKGKIGRYAARVPEAGKLVELQVKEGERRWGTVREAFGTDAKGRYRLRYQFGRFYLSPTTFKFRVKVTREQGWPYRAPVRSKTKKLTILPR